MNKSEHSSSTDHPSKKAVTLTLYAFALAIAAMGASYTIYSLLNNVSLLVLNNEVPGALFGIIITFLGIRYVFAVYKLSLKLKDPQAVFSWKNYHLSTKK
jgi:hypothetical protein